MEKIKEIEQYLALEKLINKDVCDWRDRIHKLRNGSSDRYAERSNILYDIEERIEKLEHETI